ncbi:PREDICTED: non-specific lipid-transfer protein-like isoform X2 [Lupinus angustifolius]|uniref:non-specific lipid-transfer protein-like isoform X2 n=1 Tax=Lupinus angustifolius TaxID=3871 RepID=UPI00092F5DF5|nr:PREDICTED: non-specific lipid-transfer protein-like isoform X2 [Lupinus angustifolius]
MALKKMIKMVLIMSLMVTLWGAKMTESQSSCTNVLITLSPCLDYITGNASTPSSECCSQLASVVSSQPQCLCEVVNGAASSFASSLNINQTQALALPSACRVQTPPISACTDSSYSPIGVSVSDTPNSPSGGSGNGIGSYHGSSNSTKLPFSLFLFLFLLATTFAAYF